MSDDNATDTLAPFGSPLRTQPRPSREVISVSDATEHTISTSSPPTAHHHSHYSTLSNTSRTRGERGAAQFTNSAANQRVKKHFSVCANSLTALYQESSRAYAAGAADARDDVHQYILDALRGRDHGAAETSFGELSSDISPHVRCMMTTSTTMMTPQQHPQQRTTSRRARRWIDADELLAFIALSTLQRSQNTTTSAAAGASTSGGAAVPGSAHDVAHTFGRRRPRDFSPTWASHDDDDDDHHQP
jgi:hypothetical protein